MLGVEISDGSTKEFKDVRIKAGNKILLMCFMGNQDLYWAINTSSFDSLKESIEISSEDKDIFELFDNLYNDVKDCKPYGKKDKYFQHVLADRNFFNEEAKTIEWHSDETYFDSDDIVKIIKKDDKYRIEFTRPEEYEDPFYLGNAHMISIRFRNSGSYYHPFNAVFMRMFKEAQKLKERDFKDLRDDSEHEIL